MSKKISAAVVTAFAFAGVLAWGSGLLAQGNGKKPGGGTTTEGAAAGTLRDAVGDRITSDGGGEYLGGNLDGFGGLGPECSRVSYASPQGDVRLRTVSSQCDFDSYTGPFRSVWIDLGEGLDGICDGGAFSIDKTVAGDTRALDLCGGSQVVGDVQINIDGFMVSGATESGTAEVLLSLHPPPTSNQVQFSLVFEQPLTVTDNENGTWTAGCESECGASLYDYQRNPRNGKITKVFVGRFHMPFSITARSCGVGVDPCSPS